MAQYASYTGYVGGGGGGGSVNSVTASSPVVSSGGANPNISLNTVPIAKGGTGQVTANAALNAFLPSQTGNNGKVLGTNGTNTSWVSNATTPTGTANTFAGFDGAGDLFTVPGFQIDTTSGGMNEGLTEHPNNGGGFTANNFSVAFEPLQDSPNENWNIQSIQAFMDNASSGFTQGTAGAAVQLLGLGYTHQGTGNTGTLTHLSMNNNLGNGTDPITINGLLYASAGANVQTGVTIDGQINGFTFIPTMQSGSISGSSQNTQAFWDGSQFNVPENSHVSFNASPNINQINVNNNYNGLSISPQLATLQTNAGAFGVIINPTITAMGATSNYHGMDIQGTVTTSHGNITGINVTPNIVGGDAGFTGLNINPSGGATLSNPTGLTINLSSINSTNPQGIVGFQSDSRLQVNATTQLKAAQTFQIGTRIEHAFSVPIGFPVTGTDELAVNIAGDFIVQDDVANGAFGIGFNSVGFISSMGVAATKTVDTITVFLPAASMPDPGFTTGGAVTDFHMIRTFAPLSQGGTLAITNLYGFKLDTTFGSFSGAATNAWGLYIQDSALNNFIEGKLGIGATAPHANLDVIGTIVQGDGTTRATGANAIALGISSNVGVVGLAAGIQSISLGQDTTANGANSIAGGFNTIANGDNSVALNTDSVSAGNNSVAINNATQSNGNNSFAANRRTQADADNSTAVGQFNEAVGTPGSPDPTDRLFQIGNGVSGPTRHDAFYVRLDNVVGIQDGHLRSTQATPPTISADSAAGTGASASLANATDIAGEITINTGTLGLSTGSYATVTFNVAYDTAPIVVLTPANSTLSSSVYVTRTTTTFSVNFAVAGGISSTYKLNYHVIETQ